MSFTETNCFYKDIDALSEAQAIRMAEALYERLGDKPFTIDMDRGGTDDWEAALVSGESNHHG